MARPKAGLVYLVFNSMFNLPTDDDQTRCFQNAAPYLTYPLAATVPRHALYNLPRTSSAPRCPGETWQPEVFQLQVKGSTVVDCAYVRGG